MKKILLILLFSLSCFAGGPPASPPDGTDIADLTGLSTTDMTGYPSGAQPLHNNLTQASAGKSNIFNMAEMQFVAPTNPSVGDVYTADGYLWNPGNKTTATITGSSNISFTEGTTVADTITKTTGLVVFPVGMLIKVASTTNNNGYYFPSITTDSSITVSSNVTGISDGDLDTEANTSAVLTAGYPQRVLFDGTNWISLQDNMGNLAIQYYLISSKPGDILVDGRFVGIARNGIGGATLAIGDFIAQKTDGEWYKADNNSTDSEINEARGVAVTTSTDGGNLIIGRIGTMRLDSWTWTAGNKGKKIFLSDTAGIGTETRPTDPTMLPQEMGTIVDADNMRIDFKFPDFSITRTGSITADKTLTCLEATNTFWEVTSTATVTFPSVATCSTIYTALQVSGAIAVHANPNDIDKFVYLDGTTTLSDGDKASNLTSNGDMITVKYFSTDGLVGSSNGWTDGN